MPNEGIPDDTPAHSDLDAGELDTGEADAADFVAEEAALAERADEPDGGAAPGGELHANDKNWLRPPIMALTRLVLRFPVATLALAAGLAGICVVYAATHLGYKSSRLDLLNPKNEYNRLWIDYIQEFGAEDDAVIVVEGPGREQVVPVLAELSENLEHQQRLFHSILHEIDLTKIRAKGLHYLPLDQLTSIDQFLDETLPITGGEWSRLQAGNLISRYMQMVQATNAGKPGIDAAFGLAALDRTVESLRAEFSSTPHYQSPWPSMPASLSILSELGTEYFLAKQGRMGFVLLHISVDKDELARGTEAVDALRELIADTMAKHPDVKIGLTGLPIMENDEMRASQSSMFWGGLLSFIGVVVVVIAGFGGVRHALMANIVLLIGTAWAFGYATLAVGHLNILSITFTATLVGVGIDYGTYYVSRYSEMRRNGRKCDDALLATSHIAGPAIVTGALTTVVAFFATGITNFKGIAELGIIAGGGILLCALAQLFVLPAMVQVVDKSRFGKAFPKPVPVHSGIRMLMRTPRLVMMLAVAVTIVGGFGLPKLWFDYNLLNLQPEGLESVKLERRLLSECDQSMWYAISVADSRDELLERKEKFSKLASVDRMEEIASLMSGDDSAKRPIIAKIGNRLASLPERPPLVAVDSMEQIGFVLAHAQELAQQTPNGAGCAHHVELLRDAMRRLNEGECQQRLSKFQQQTAGDLLSRLHAARGSSNPEPPTLADLPSSYVNRFVGKNRKFLLRIYGKGDIWNMDSLSKFVHDIRSVDPRATGNPLQTYECSLEMKRSYQNATLYSLIVIFGVLYLDFRNLKHVAMAAFPQFMGIALTFGLLGFLNEPMNPANLIAVPMILGIGVDYSVYIVHEYLEQKGRYRMSPGTAIAVSVDSLTTLIGYGSLLIASHRGLQSLGRVLTIAVTFSTLMSVVALPAFLVWLTRKRPLIPWVGAATQSFDHEELAEVELELETDPIPHIRHAA